MRTLADAGTAYVKVKGDFSGLNSEVAKQASLAGKSFSGRFGKAMGPVLAQQSKHLESFTRAAKYATIGAAGLAAYGFKDVVETGAAFEKQMSVNAAVSEATTKQLAKLEKQSIKLGKATFYSAGQTAEAQGELIKGGLSLQQVLGGGLAAALSLAEAGELELATAATTTVNAMKLFGIEGKEAQKVADGLATAANKTTADVEDFAMAFNQGGGAVKAAGGDFNDALTILEAMAEAGYKNSDAGTSMKTALVQLAAPTKKQKELTEELNLHFFDQNGNLKSAVGLSEELRRALKNREGQERLNIVKTLAGTDGFRTLLSLWEAGPQKLAALEKANAKQGTAQEVAGKKMDNFSGDLEKLKGSLETVEIQIFKGMAPALSKLTGEAEHAANRIGDVFDNENLSGSEKVEKAISVLSEELGGIWDRNDMTEHVVDFVDAAIPIIAESASHAGLKFAESFGKGFLHADPLGKALMAAWALHFIGGKAPFIAAGKSVAKAFGVTAFSTVGGAAKGLADTRGATPANPVFVKESMVDVGPGTGPGGAKGEKPSRLGSLAEKLGPAAGAVAPWAGVFGGTVAGALYLNEHEGLLGADPKREAAAARVQRAARKHASEGVRGGRSIGGPFAQPDAFNAIAGTKAGENVIKKSFTRINADAAKGMAAVNQTLSARLHTATETWGKNTPKWRQHTVEAMHGAVKAIREGMDDGSIKTQVGQKRINQLLAKIKFSQSGDPIGLAKAVSKEFQKTGGITDGGIKAWLRKLDDLPKGSRTRAMDAINGMVKSWAAGHPKLEAQFDRLTEAEKRKFGAANKQLETSTKQAMGHTTTSVSEAAQQTGAGMSNIFTNLSSALQAVGSSKIPTFKLVALDPNGASLGRQRGGPINLGAPSGDTVPAMLERGEYVLNRNAVKAVGAHNLDRLNFRTAKRFQVGGSTAAETGRLPHPGLLGPEPARDLGQRAVDKGWKAAQIYLRKHMEPARVLKMLRFAEAEAAKGFPYVYGGGHGSFSGPYDCSGYVSAILHAGGFLDAPMSVQVGSGLYTLGAAGPGKFFTIGVRGTSGQNAHTMMSIKAPGNKWKYFESGGSGGGAHETGGWDGAFQFRHIPGFQRGGQVPEKAKEAIAKYGQSAFDPRNKHFVGWGYQRGGLIPRLQKLAKGGWVKTGYTIYTGSGVGAGGDLQKGHGYAELGTATSGGVGTGTGFIAQALGRSGELPMEFPLDVKIGSKVAKLYKRDRGYGQGEPYYSIDIHSLAWPELGLSMANGKGDAFIRPADGSAAESDEHSFKEDVPHTFHGLSTQTLHFPSTPKNLPGLDREINRWSKERSRYKTAIKAAKKANKPAVAQALEHNLTDIDNHLRELRNEKVKQRRELAKKRFTKFLSRRFAKLTGFESAIDGARQVYEKRSQYAEQVVDLEPLQPEIPAKAKGETDPAYEAKREGMEKAYVSALTGYIEGQEKPAYQSVLSSEADWRNVILQAEKAAVGGNWQKSNFLEGMEGSWEDRIVALVQNEEGIESFAENAAAEIAKWRREHPKAKGLPEDLKNLQETRTKLLDKLPFLKFKEGELRKTLGEGRGLFYPGKARTGYELRTNPGVPSIGSGTFEEALKDVQGIHWPDQHEFLGSLPAIREAGKFGGAIWETQTAIAELGLKISQAASSIEGAGSESDSGEADARKIELLELERDIARQGAQRGLVSETLRNTIAGFNRDYPLPPYAGKAHTGAIVPGPAGAERTMIVKSGEGIFTQEQMAALGGTGTSGPVIESLVIHGDGRAIMRYQGHEFETAVKRVVKNQKVLRG